MDRKEFINQLTQELKDQSYESVTQSILYYEEMIDDMIENGMNEKEAILKLGSMSDIVNSIKESSDMISVKPMKKTKSLGIIVLLVFMFPLWGAVLATVLLLALTGYILVWCIPLVSICIAIAGIIGFAMGIFGAFPLLVMNFSLGLSQLGVSALFGGIGMLGVWTTMNTLDTIMKMTSYLTYWIKRLFMNVLEKVGIIC